MFINCTNLKASGETNLVNEKKKVVQNTNKDDLASGTSALAYEHKTDVFVFFDTSYYWSVRCNGVEDKK